MDRLTALELFVRIVERRSFSAAAVDLQISRSVATATIKALEQRLGTRLLQRSTRSVQPTVEGEAYHRRCVDILAEIEDADRSVSGGVAGLLRVDVPGNLARSALLPALPDFLARHPGLRVQIGEGERLVDLVSEGIDCVVRAGALADSDMVVRPLGVMDEVTCASPAYLARHGAPTSPDALDGHEMIAFVSSRTGRAMPLEFMQDGARLDVELPARLLTSSADLSAEAARRGLGLVQAPRHRFAADLEAGVLVEVLAGFRPEPTPLSILYPSRRQLSPRVRVFADWVQEVLAPHMSRSGN